MNLIFFFFSHGHGAEPPTVGTIYSQLIAQRIAQGFQCILDPRSLWEANQSSATQVSLSTSPYPFVIGQQRETKKEEHILSIGRVFHKVAMINDVITVKRYWPRHPYPLKSHHYTYRFQVVYHTEKHHGQHDSTW